MPSKAQTIHVESPKVWVVQEGNNDYAPAEKFGEVRFITNSDLRAMTPQQAKCIGIV